VGTQGVCRNDATTFDTTATVGAAQAVERNNEAALERAVAEQPVAVGIDAYGRAFQFYKGGVFSGPCDTRIDHGVTAVGYGAGGRKYWILRNCWGETWGEKGLHADGEARRGQGRLVRHRQNGLLPSDVRCELRSVPSPCLLARSYDDGMVACIG
jgi:hypothetical protein